MIGYILLENYIVKEKIHSTVGGTIIFWCIGIRIKDIHNWIFNIKPPIAEYVAKEITRIGNKYDCKIEYSLKIETKDAK